MKKNTIALVLLLFISLHVVADDAQSGFEVMCNNKDFRLSSFGWTNTLPDRPKNKDAKNYKEFDKKTITCSVGIHNIKAEMNLPNKGAGGRCGSSGYVSLWVNNNILIHNASFDCSKHLKSIAISGYPRGGYQLELCGNSGFNSLPRFIGCVTIHSDNLERMSKPLGPIWSLTPLLQLFSYRHEVEKVALEKLFKTDGLTSVLKVDTRINSKCSIHKLVSVKRAPLPAPYSWRTLVIDRCGELKSYLVKSQVFQNGDKFEPNFKVIDQLINKEDYLRLISKKNGLSCESILTVSKVNGKDEETFNVSCAKSNMQFQCKFYNLSEYIENETKLSWKSPCWRVE